MIKYIKIILPIVAPILVLAITGMLYMWRDQAVQNEKTQAGLNEVKQLILSQKDIFELEFTLLDKDIKRVNLDINKHEAEDRRLMTALFNKLEDN